MKDVQLTFGKYAGKKLSQTPNDYQAWLQNQVWFRVKFLQSGETLEDDKPIMKRLSPRGKKLLRDLLNE